MILAACFGGAKAYIDHQLHIELDTSIQSVAELVPIEYSEVSTSLLGSVYIRHLRLTIPNSDPILINTITLYKAYQFYNPNKLPQHISMAIQGIQIPIPISDTAAPTPVLVSAFGYAPYYFTLKELRELGYARINADIHIEAKPDKHKMSLWGKINAQAWGELTLSADLNNVPTPASLSIKTASQIQLAELTLSYTNKGFINRIFTHLARRNKMTVNRLKYSLINQLKNSMSQAKITLDASVLTSLQQFIQTPDRLTIHLKPNPPLTINTPIYTFPKSLGLKMTTINSN
ncbi:MAG: hypothetical protein DRQ49_07700 [Gammaproteobacteria bacterium]|nr:MAG: hypothetical protein DRQ49_07700 [Gammaproteobacteria bacterium]RKZ76203.1 MAG: hypothetical protein DRQ57_04785 [Gammaproteobacteria bacterium]